MDVKCLIHDSLEELIDEELKLFTWHLWNGVTSDIDPIPRGKLQKADRQDVVDCMVQYYKENAGTIAVQALRNMRQNDRAERLQSELQKVQQPRQEEEEEELAAASEELQPIQSDWRRPMRVSACPPDLKMRILNGNKNEVYMPVDEYKKKGLALLITNIKFAERGMNRDGAEKDEENMEWLLKALGYTVVKYTNLSANEISTKVKNFSMRSEHRASDSTFVVIMSHGQRIQNKDAISGAHGNGFYFVEETFLHLNSENCPALIDKPKVILIQACRGGQSGGVEVQDQVPESDDSSHPSRMVHKEKDFVCFMSSLPHISAYRNTDNGSYFISYIVEHFCRSACKDHIMELFRKVASSMEKDQRFQNRRRLLPCIERTSLVKNFYLFPKP